VMMKMRRSLHTAISLLRLVTAAAMLNSWTATRVFVILLLTLRQMTGRRPGRYNRNCCYPNNISHRSLEWEGGSERLKGGENEGDRSGSEGPAALREGVGHHSQLWPLHWPVCPHALQICHIRTE
jgi:hypothetical protein